MKHLSMNEHTTRQLVLLFGSPRSGTTWLGTILSSHPDCVYRHEPTTATLRTNYPLALQKAKAGMPCTAIERAEVVRLWARAYHETCRPPFFRKSYCGWPPFLQWSAWLLCRHNTHAQHRFQHRFTPGDSASFNLVVKEVGWELHAEALARALNANLIVIIRHPCGVVASQLRGRRHGWLTPVNRQKWCQWHADSIIRLGYAQKEVLELPDHMFCAVRWLVANVLFQQGMSQLPAAQWVVYDSLCDHTLEVSRNMFSKLGWDVPVQTLAFIRRSTAKEGTCLGRLFRGKQSYFDVYKNPQQSKASWKHVLSKPEQAGILEVASRFDYFKTFWPSN